MTDPKHMDIAEFRNKGYLAEVNRRFLHPLGLALEVVADDEGNEMLGAVIDCRDDPEGFIYADAVVPQIAQLKARIDAEWERRREARVAALGFMTQPMPDPP